MPSSMAVVRQDPEDPIGSRRGHISEDGKMDGSDLDRGGNHHAFLVNSTS
jgi:hypothetical protein